MGGADVKLLLAELKESALARFPLSGVFAVQ
jgi:hypothetical protein